MGIKTIRVQEEAHKELTDLAKSHGMNIGEFTEEMVNYFKRTKSDPRQREDTVTTLKQVKKELNRLIGFIKTNEKEHLKPILDSLEVTRRNLNNNVHKLDDIAVLKTTLQSINKQIEPIYKDWKSVHTNVKTNIKNQLILNDKFDNNTDRIINKSDKINARFNVLRDILVWIREFEENIQKSTSISSDGGIWGYKKEEMNKKLSDLKKVVEQL
jgi:flagellar motility protein MotE (MotC chaperone)